MMGDRDPIVAAVLGDPVVKAVLSDPTAAPAVAAAVGVDVAGIAPAPVTGSVLPGQAGAAQPSKPDVMILPSGRPVAAPTTTEEEDRATVGQRRINLIWEGTQGVIAILVTWYTLKVAAHLAMNVGGDAAAFLLLSNAFFVVVTTYIVRTNHSKTGGVSKGDTGR